MKTTLLPQSPDASSPHWPGEPEATLVKAVCTPTI